jgi:hypothetical protein
LSRAIDCTRVAGGAAYNSNLRVIACPVSMSA